MTSTGRPLVGENQRQASVGRRRCDGADGRPVELVTDHRHRLRFLFELGLFIFLGDDAAHGARRRRKVLDHEEATARQDETILLVVALAEQGDALDVAPVRIEDVELAD